MASVLELILRSRKEGDAAKKTEAELKRLSEASGVAGAAAKRLNLGLLAVKGAVITAGAAFLKSIPAILEQGVQIERAETALIAYSGSAEEAARTIELMKDAAGGAMSRMDAMRNATRLLSMGLADNADQAAKMTEVAITLGSTMGKGPQAALEDFSLMLANQSIPRLDTFGIAGARVREIMADLAEQGIAPTDRQTRFLMATMEVAEEKMRLLGDAGYEATSNVDRLKATIDDAKASVVTWISDGLMPWVDGIFAVRDALAEQKAGTDAAIASTEQIAIAASDAAAANRDFALSLGDVTSAQLAKEAMDKLNEAYQSGWIDLDTYKDAYYDVSRNLAGMDEDAIRAQIRLADLNAEFAETGDLDAYIAKIMSLSGYIGDIPTTKKTTIQIEYQIEKPPTMLQHGGSGVVPPGFPNDTYPIFLSSGEQYQVTPASHTTTHQDNRQLFGPGAQVNVNEPVARETVFSWINEYFGA